VDADELEIPRTLYTDESDGYMAMDDLQSLLNNCRIEMRMGGVRVHCVPPSFKEAAIRHDPSRPI
jgi:hypothetical protein